LPQKEFEGIKTTDGMTKKSLTNKDTKANGQKKKNNTERAASVVLNSIYAMAAGWRAVEGGKRGGQNSNLQTLGKKKKKETPVFQRMGSGTASIW